MQGKLITVFGGGGFLGRYVAQALLSQGARLRIACRNANSANHIKPLGNLGQVQLMEADIRKSASVKRAVMDADAVVNLVGSFGGDLMQLMGNSAGEVASAAKASGAEALVHISAIGADADSASTYARANALGEQLVRENFVNASILRPSALFGEDDNFVNMFAGLVQMMPVLPVFGPSSRLQPAFVDDLAEAIANALEDPGKHGGKTFELGGPEVITMMELNQRIAGSQGRKRTFLPVPDTASAVFAALPLTPINRDQWVMLKEGNCASGDYPGFKKLGVTPRPLGLFLDKWMVRYRKHGRFNEGLAS